MSLDGNSGFWFTRRFLSATFLESGSGSGSGFGRALGELPAPQVSGLSPESDSGELRSVVTRCYLFSGSGSGFGFGRAKGKSRPKFLVFLNPIIK